MFQSFVSMGMTAILWWCFCYSLAFSTDVGNGFIGDLNRAFTIGMDSSTPYLGNPKIPEAVFYVYQLAFAMVTPALITGAFAGRVRVRAYLIFLVLWLIFVYVPWAHWIWGGGWAAQWGVLDFAGGIVVHTTAGMSALSSVFFVGPRKNKRPEVHSVPLVALGTGLLWFGWFGFNAGSALTVNGITGIAFFNTDLAGAAGATSWFFLEWIITRKPHLIGFLTGAVAGLATITPCAGFVQPWAAFAIGVAAGILCYGAVTLRQKLNWDDALDVWGVHGVGGAFGSVVLGLLCSSRINPLAADGAFYGNPLLLGKQIAAVALATVHAFVLTYVFLWLINKVVRVRLTDEEAQMNIDEFEHGESTYAVKPAEEVPDEPKYSFSGYPQELEENGSVELKTRGK
jgi:Amt family ammonium transporter